MEVMRRHPMDKTSPEARITDYTVKIRNFLHHFLKVDPWVRIILNHSIEFEKIGCGENEDNQQWVDIKAEQNVE
ncbi:unnamed protein product [Oppiella nova]|uniref:Uncharacterized protein n=1 Tax=Oppiella nova TaxID=334625 RepID=A0A7R9MUJ4_9ACAR|nr:unnamed protein product [Oppiella nova]CAG2183089.1 unnamed protein product [Oppiella nova]